MKDWQQKKRVRYARRVQRTRAKINGTAKRPRVAVFRSRQHMAVQLIDDEAGRTICAASDHELKKHGKMKKTEVAKAVGVLIAEKAGKAGIKQVVFDRRGNQYHGRIKAIADSMREKGLVV
jgi:large subunit ribosomal protein L18